MMSAARVTQLAPHSLMIRWHPADWAEVTGPGTAIERLAQVGSVPRGVQGSAALARLHDHGAAGEGSNDPVADQGTTSWLGGVPAAIR